MLRTIATVLLPLAFLLCACDGNDNDPKDTDATLPDTAQDDDALDPDDNTLQPDEETDPIAALFGTIVLNPSGAAPLTAEIPFTPDAPGKLTLRIECDGIDTDTPYEKSFSFSAEGTIALPILGLYPDCANVLTFTLFTVDGIERGSHTAAVATAPIPEDFPIVTAAGNYIGDAFTFIVYYQLMVSDELPPDDSPETIDGTLPAMTGIMFDKNGTVRWYSSFSYKFLFPMEFIDGHIYGGDWQNDMGLLQWYDLMGRQQGTIDIGALGYLRIHHDIIKKPDGNLIITADLIGNDYIEDHLIEVKPATGELVRTWDLNKTMPDVADLYRDVPMTSPETPGYTNDPIHLNGVAYDAADDSIIISSQRSGVAKIKADETMAWYLAPQLTRYIDDANGDGVSDSFVANYDPNDQLSWIGDYTGDKYVDERQPIAGKPADGYPFDFNYGELLLTPLDDSGNAITDHDTLFGFTDSADFRWPFRPHAPLLKEDGTLMLFDNGLARGFGIINADTFSRAVAYRIEPDEDGYGGTVQQTAEYILGSDPSWHRFSAVVGDVDELADGSLLVVSGALATCFYPAFIMSQYGDGPRGAYVAQIDTATGDELHSLLIERVITDVYPNAPFSVYRAERIEPYGTLKLPAGLTIAAKVP